MDPSLFYEFNTIAAGTGVSLTKTTLPQSKRSVFKLAFSEGIELTDFL